jgi:hypothetical protein
MTIAGIRSSTFDPFSCGRETLDAGMRSQAGIP